MFIFVLQMRMNVRLGIRVHMPATTRWAPTTAPVPEASPSQPTGGRVRVQNSPPPTDPTRQQITVKPLLSSLLDVDECSLGGNVCHDAEDCENTIGSYRCVTRCGRGFRRTADGYSCTGLIVHVKGIPFLFNRFDFLITAGNVCVVQM